MRGLLTLAATICLLAGTATAARRQISRADLRDRIEGGWAGQMIGVSFGAPTEFRFNQKVVPDDRMKWSPEMVSNSLDQDDLYVDMTFAKVLDDKGLNATTADFGAMLRDAKYRLWHANLSARRALKRGIPAELSGSPKYNAHANDIDFQIESDFIGLMTPGLPQSANRIALRAGQVMNSGDGIIGGMFMSGMYAAAFFETDVRRVVEQGLAAIPRSSPYARIIADVLAWSKQYPGDWEKVWSMVNAKWDQREPCPEGALLPFNIDAKLNGAYVALGLLYGKGDFGKTIEYATRAGQDSDCNPANAGGIVGVMLGYRKIPDNWKSGIPGIADKNFNYTDFNFHEIVASTEKRALALIAATGGSVDEQNAEVNIQLPKPLAVKLWDNYGSPLERIAYGDARWQFKGDWRAESRNRTASAAGSEASIEFEGTGVIVVGTLLPKGGTGTIYLDGKMQQSVDVCSDETSNRNGESVWHSFGLPNGKHTVKLVVDGKPGPGSDRNDVAIEGLVVFRKNPISAPQCRYCCSWRSTGPESLPGFTRMISAGSTCVTPYTRLPIWGARCSRRRRTATCARWERTRTGWGLRASLVRMHWPSISSRS
jgi:hypothetical protein